MSYILTFLAGWALHLAYTKGWLVTPAIFIVKTVNGLFEKKPTALPLLDIANAAPEASPADRQKFWMTGIYIGAGLLGLVAVLIGSVVWYKSFSKAQPIPKVEAPAVQESPTAPVIAAPKQAPKKATKPAAKPAITAPAMPATVETKAKKPAEPLTQFDRDLINFESKLP